MSKIEKVNGFWVPNYDVHIEQWRAGRPFTQNKCLKKFINYCETQNKNFNTIIDVGAWCGTWSKAMEKFSKRIIAFEPDNVAFECLSKNCTINCSPRQEAVGSENKYVSLNEDDFTQAQKIDLSIDSKKNIRMITLDSLEVDKVDMIKIDVEGYEMEVLKGAEKMLQSIKFLMIELNNNTKNYGSSNIEIEKHLESLGFKVLLNHWPDTVFYRI